MIKGILVVVQCTFSHLLNEKKIFTALSFSTRGDCNDLIDDSHCFKILQITE